MTEFAKLMLRRVYQNAARLGAAIALLYVVVVPVGFDLRLADLTEPAGTARITLGARMLSAAPGDANSNLDPLSVRLNWEARRGASAYLLQVRDADGDLIVDERVQGDAYTFKVQPGDYTQRIAAVNRIGGTGRWSRWQDLRIRVSRKPLIGAVRPEGQPQAGGNQTVAVNGRFFTDHTRVFLARPGRAPREVPVVSRSPSRLLVTLRPVDFADGRYNLIVRNPRGQERSRNDTVAVVNRRIEIPEEAQAENPELANIPEDGSDPNSDDIGGPGRWQTLIPGLPAYQRGKSPGVWAGAIGGMLLLTATEYEAGITEREAFESKPYAQFFNNLGLFSFITLTNNPSRDQLGLWALAYTRDRAKASAAVARHQRNQQLLGGGLLLTWGAHFIRENRDNLHARHLVPGLTQLRRGQSARAGFWMGSLGALALGALHENQAAEREFRGVKSNPVGRLAADPAVVLAFNTLVPESVSGLSLQETLLVHASARNNESRKIRRGKAHRRRASYLSAALLTLYLAQFVDATLGGEPAAELPPPSDRPPANGDAAQNGGYTGSYGTYDPYGLLPGSISTQSLIPAEEVQHFSVQIHFD